jgi:hypothetical protein
MRIFSRLSAALAFAVLLPTLAMADDGEFHAPATQAERALHDILAFDTNPANAKHRLNILQGSTDTSLLTEWLTPELKTELAATEAELVQQECDGQYIDHNVCGFGFDPLLCAQDVSDSPYMYYTTQADASQAIIEYRWREDPDNTYGRYKMVRKGTSWQLDGIDCAQLGQFNW